MNPQQADTALVDSLVPLLPLRTADRTHFPLSADFWQPHSQAVATHRWNRLLNRAASSLLQGERLDAARSVQRAQALKNDFEAAHEEFVQVTSGNWMTIAACSLALQECDSAAAFAVRAWESTGQSWQDDLLHDCSDVRADATTLMAVIRMCQHRPDRATELIRKAISDHQHVGAMEQLAADHMILSLCRELCQNSQEAAAARSSARRIVETSLDPSRHRRTASLARWLTRFGHPRPLLLNSSEIV